MKSFTPTTSFSNSRAFLASVLTCIMLAAPLTPLGFASTNASLIQSKSKSTAKQPSAPQADAPASAVVRQQKEPPVTALAVGPITATKTDNRTAAQPVGPTNTINYTVTITNTGSNDALGVALADVIDTNTTLVPSSIQSTPLANPDTYNVIGNVRIQPNAAQGLLANDFNPDNGNNGGITASGGTSSAQGGSLTISPDGSFSYNPAPGFTGTDTFTYTVTNTTTNKTDTSTVTLSVGNGTPTPGTSVIWFINNDAGAPAGNDGRLTSPFNSIASYNASAVTKDPGDIIFIYTGTAPYTGPLVLLNNQQLIGQGVDLATASGFTVQPYSNTLPAAGSAPTINSAAAAGSNTITLNSTGVTGANTIRGVTLGNATDSDITGNNFGTLTVSATTLNGTGRALNLSNGTLAATFTSITSTASPSQGVGLTSIAGSLASTGGTTISGNPTQCVLVSGSTLSADFGNTSCTGGTDGISLQNNSGANARTFGTLNVSGGSGSAFLHSVQGGNTTVTGAANLASTGNPIEIQNQGNGQTISFAATTVTKTSAGGAGVNRGGTNTGATLGFASLALTTSNGPGLVAVGGGTINVTTGTISATGSAGQAAPAISTNGVTFGATFTSVSSTNSGNSGNGISLTGVLGNLTMNGGSISGAAGDAFLVSGGNANITDNGTISTSAARPVNVASMTGGTVNFGGAVSSTSNGVLLNSNTGATFNFTGGLSLSTGANNAFSATAGGTVNVCDESPCNPNATGALVNTLTTTTGIALNVNATTIGANKLEFRSISANGATKGISLNTTGSGGLTVLGTGTTAGSGGTIQNISARGAEFISANNITLKNMNFTNANTADAGAAGVCDDTTTTGCNAVVYLNNVATVSLDRLNITGTIAEEGINGNIVNALTLSNSTIGASGQPCGDAVEEGCFKMRQLTGASSITASTLRFAAEDVLEILNTSGSLTFNVDGSTFSDTQPNPPGSTGMIVRAAGTSSIVLNVTNSNFLRIRSIGLNATAQDSATLDADVSTSTFDPGTGVGIGVALASNNTATMVFNIQNNPMIHSRGGGAISVLGDGTSTFTGRIQNNPNVRVLCNGAGCPNGGVGTPIAVQTNNNAVGRVAITSNVAVTNANDQGIAAIAGGKTAGTGGTLDVTITSNTITTNPVALYDIETRAGGFTAGDQNIVCANVVSNTASWAAQAGGIAAYRARVASTGATLKLQGFNTNAATTWINNGNTPANAAAVSQSVVGGGIPISACTATVPSNPALDSDFAPNGTLETNGAASSVPVALASLTKPTSDITAQPFVAMPQAQTAQAVKVALPLQASADNARAAQAKAPAVTNSATQDPVVTPSVANFPITIGTLGAGKTVTITFSVMVNNPLAPSVTQIKNRGTVSGTNFLDVTTVDPDGSDPQGFTITNVIPQPTITINNANAPEPQSGSAPMPFSVVLSGAYTVPVTVNFQTADGTAKVADGDYTATSGTLNFAAGDTFQTISVPVLADGVGGESNENFTVTLSAPVAGTINGTGIGTGTITAANPPGRVLISELRTSGPGGAGDDFIELYNNQDVSQNISGWAIVKSGAGCTSTPIIVAVIPAATTIPARGHYLITGPAYSLAASVPGNATVAAVTDIESDRNIGLFNTSNLLNLSTATREDAVGFDANLTGNNCDLLREGASLVSTSGSLSQYSYARRLTTGLPQETNDNAGDFQLVTTTPAVAVGNNLTPALGAPGPENLAAPIQRNASIKPSLVDGTVAANAPPNRVRSGIIDPGGPNAFGTLSIQRKFTNTLAVSVTRLRFRVVDVTSVNNRPPGSADLRVLSSTGVVRNSAGTIVRTVNGLTLEAPPQPNGGGLNSALTVVLPGGLLAPGNSIEVQFLLGVQEQGGFSFFVNVEALPGPPGAPGPLPGAAATKNGTTEKQRNAEAATEPKQQEQQ